MTRILKITVNSNPSISTYPELNISATAPVPGESLAAKARRALTAPRDLCDDLASALDWVNARAAEQRAAAQHQAITRVFGAWLDGLPALRWTQPYGAGPVGVQGAAETGDIADRVSAVASYAIAVGNATVSVDGGHSAMWCQASIAIGMVPVTVHTVLWQRTSRWNRRPKPAKVEADLARLIGDLGVAVTVTQRG